MGSGAARRSIFGRGLTRALRCSGGGHGACAQCGAAHVHVVDEAARLAGGGELNGHARVGTADVADLFAHTVALVLRGTWRSHGLVRRAHATRAVVAGLAAVRRVACGSGTDRDRAMAERSIRRADAHVGVSTVGAVDALGT